ncbi:MAG: hypothetical protein F9K30_17755 [Dechloromonas sp.]|nr:MAG: hypothetical protein F9K30_17755 [Dechloromonas sp.]
MRTLFRSVSRLLLLVMLATVFSPSFGWEVAQGMAAHDQPALGNGSHEGHDADHGHAGHDSHAQHHDATRHDACGSACSAQDSCADTRHHCCPGHVLGHLLGGTGERLAAVIVAGASVVPVACAACFSSRIPDGLERPPRASAA